MIDTQDNNDHPNGQLTLKVPAMPKDSNAAGDIFGGWLMSQMDLTAGARASEIARGRIVTAAVKEMSFERPVKIGDTLALYTSHVHIGHTSIRMRVEAWAIRYLSHKIERVTSADFIMVALDNDGKPRPVNEAQDID